MIKLGVDSIRIQAESMSKRLIKQAVTAHREAVAMYAVEELKPYAQSITPESYRNRLGQSWYVSTSLSYKPNKRYRTQVTSKKTATRSFIAPKDRVKQRSSTLFLINNHPYINVFEDGYTSHTIEPGKTMPFPKFGKNKFAPGNVGPLAFATKVKIPSMPSANMIKKIHNKNHATVHKFFSITMAKHVTRVSRRRISFVSSGGRLGRRS